MTASTPKAPYAVLYVDDELKALHYFREAFQDDFVIHTASNAWDGYQILVEHGPQIGVLLTDQRMPGENGVELMEKARLLNPNIVRILVTAYAEYQTAVDAVNAGHAFRYLHKPWDPEELATAIEHGLRYYEAMTEREQLLAEKSENVRKMIMGDRVAGMGILAEGLNHHVRNALTVIRAFIELAPQKLAEEMSGQDPNDTSFWQGWHSQALSQMDRIQTLLSHLSSASHARRVNRNDYVNLVDLLAEAMNRYSEALISKGIHVAVELEKDLPCLTVNKERFQQLWHLILTQALTDLKEGDHLTIEGAHQTGPCHGGQLVLRICDNADWPNRERTSNLFDPFFVRGGQPQEFGVNMMACYVIVHLHGGSIAARPIEPKGLELEIRMPVEPPDQIESEEDFFIRLHQHEERWRVREQLTDSKALAGLPLAAS
jgi:two-component system probable response regulator PhcQ